MKYLVVPDNPSSEWIRDSIVDLRQRQRAAVIPSTGAELGQDIDELLELLPH